MKPPKPEAARPGAGDGATDGGSQDPREAWPGTSPTGASDAEGDEAPEEGAAFQALTGAGTEPGTAEAPALRERVAGMRHKLGAITAGRYSRETLVTLV
ncbi:hypothetical protein ABZ768_31340, partial [Streptomyces griseoaurantiacus]